MNDANHRRRLLVSLFVGVISAGCPTLAGPATFRGLGYLTNDGLECRPMDVSADGLVVVGLDRTPVGGEAFRWTASGGMVGLGDIGGHSYSYACGVSTDGSVVVGASLPRAFRWTQSAGMVGIGDGTACDTSCDGSVVVGWQYGEAFRWTQLSGMSGLGALAGGINSYAYGVSPDGTVAVGYSTYASGREAFRWTESGGMVGLGDLPGGEDVSEAEAASTNGEVIVGYSESTPGDEAFRWTESNGMVGLGDLPGGYFHSRAYDVSADGSVVVGMSVAAGNRAFIWDEVNGMRSLEDVLTNEYGLDLTGWQLNEAYAVSADGRTIVGAGWGPTGYQPWIATLGNPAEPIPAPGAILLAASGAAMAGWLRHRRPL